MLGCADSLSSFHLLATFKVSRLFCHGGVPHISNRRIRIFTTLWSVQFRMLKSNIRFLELIHRWSRQRTLKNLSTLLVDVKRNFNSAVVICTNSRLFILIIIVSLKCWSRIFNSRSILVLIDFERVAILILVRSSNESTFFWNEFIEVLSFVFGLLSSEGRHPYVEGVHGSWHGVDEFWLSFVYEAINFICIFFNLFSPSYHVIIRLMPSQLTWTSPLASSVISISRIFSPKVNSLFVLESFDFESFPNPIAQGLVIVWEHHVLQLRR